MIMHMNIIFLYAFLLLKMVVTMNWLNLFMKLLNLKLNGQAHIEWLIFKQTILKMEYKLKVSHQKILGQLLFQYFSQQIQ